MNRNILPILFVLFTILVISANAEKGLSVTTDTVIVSVFTWDDPSPEGWGAAYKGVANFPVGDQSWEKILMVKKLKCDSATKGDKYPCGEWDYITQTIVYLPKGDTVEPFQLASFITPYGKRLKLGGEEGWTWIYDVTDYAPILKGDLKIKAGNNQELQDLKFLFIKGTPPRDVLTAENLYPTGSYKYEYLSDDSLLKAKKLVLNKDAKGFRLRARISGHGHNGPRNCCEWDSKTHTYFINDWEHFRWNVWKDCGFNPIYPQGGTWQFDRAGWCPGTFVDTYDFELTGKVQPGDTMLIDYAIQPYADNGEKDGNYIMSHQYFTYGPPNFENDAALVDILAPTTNQTYSRINPTCTNPIIIIKNTGKFPLKSLTIEYGTKSGKKSKYTWHGNLDFLETEEVWLPTPSWKKAGNDPVFEVMISGPNGIEDQYSPNNYLSSEFELPELLPQQFILHIETNGLGRAVDNEYYITDEDGRIVYSRCVFEDSTTYNDTIILDKGCYEFRLIDRMEDGMIRHWWNRGSHPELIGRNGKIEIRSMDDEVIRPFYYDFAQEMLYRFRVGKK